MIDGSVPGQSSRTVRVLGLDPGIELCGWALLDVYRGQPARYIACGHDPVGVVVEKMKLADRIAVETPKGYIHKRANGPCLLRTARQAGYLVAQAEREGVVVVERCAEDWRRDFGLKRPPPGRIAPGWADQQIAHLVRVHVVGLPSRTNEHERDAMGLAVACAWCPVQRPEQMRLPGVRGRR